MKFKDARYYIKRTLELIASVVVVASSMSFIAIMLAMYA